MLMTRLFATIALAALMTLPASTATATQDTDCEDISAYIEMVDMRAVEEMHALVTEPGWAEEAQIAAETLNASGSDIENLTVEELQPLLDYIAIPGMVLDGIDASDVPEGAVGLHESATRYWGSSRDMLDAVLEEGSGAAFPFLEIIETSSQENLAAQADISQQCPEIPVSYEVSQDRLDTLFEVIDGEGDPELLADASPEDLEGMGFFFLFFAEETAFAREPAQVSTPAMKPRPVTVSTPED